jgi:hypothetical protein
MRRTKIYCAHGLKSMFQSRQQDLPTQQRRRDEQGFISHFGQYTPNYTALS